METNPNELETKKKGNKSIIIIIILSLIVLALGGYFVYEKLLTNNNTSNNKNTNQDNSQKTDNPVPNDNSSEKVNPNIFSVITKSDKKIYALTKDENEIELFDVSEYNGVIYTYSASKLYLYTYKYTPGKIDVNTGKTIQEFVDNSTLGYIDLSNDNYSFIKLADIDGGSPSSIAVANNIIYYTSTGFDGIYQYNIETNNVSPSNNFNFDEKTRVDLYTISNDKMAYSIAGTADESPTIGIIDIKSNTRKEISPKARVQYIYNGNIIYIQYDENNYSKWNYYEYNVNSENKQQISDNTSSDQDINNSFIIPVDNYYIYVNMNSLYKYENNQSQKIYEFDGGINSINLISSKKLNIVYGSGMNTAAKYGIFDLNKLEYNDIQEKYSYSQAIYLPS